MTDYKEAYHALRSQHSELQRQYHERTEELKRTNVQLSKIENLMRTKERLDASGGGGGGAPSSAALRGEHETIIKGLYQDKARLERRNGELERKGRAMAEALEKRKREVAVLKRAARGRAGNAAAAAASGPKGDDARSLSQGKLAELVQRFKLRVEDAEEQLESLRVENRDLRDAAKRSGRPLVVHAPSVAEVRESAASSPKKAGGGSSKFLEGLETEKLERELREAKAEVQLLQMRYDTLESKAKAQRDIQKSQFDQLDEYNRRIRDLRRALQDAQADKEDAERKASRVDELQERVGDLQGTNRRLEDELTKLCEAPFISEAYDKQDRANRLSELERNDRDAKAHIEHLQEGARAYDASLKKLREKVEALRGEKEHAEHQLTELRLRFKETEAGNELLQDKMKLYMGDEGVDMEELERALTIVKRRELAREPDQFDFLEKVDPEVTDDLKAPDLKRKLDKLREDHLQLQYELERSEKMLKVQMSINRDLHLELEDKGAKQGGEKRDLIVKLEDYEALNVKRLQRINVLEAQLRQARYATTKRGGGGPPRAPRGLEDDAASVASESTAGNALLMELKSGELAADENLVEVWIVGMDLDDGLVSPGSSTFAVVDFLNFESQATQWLPGTKPEFDFATSYKVSVDDLFLRYLATESLDVEVCEAQQADYELVAKCAVPLAPLLDSRPTLVVERCPLIAARSGRKCGTAHVEVRLALPVTELYQLFLDRHPAERQAIEKVMLAQLGADASPDESNDDAAGKLVNEVEIVVHSASGLRGRADDAKPSPYVHYQLLQFADSFTPVQRATADPTFEHVLSFPLATTAQALALLRTERLAFTVLDFVDEGDGGAGADDALVGSVEVSLGALADGESVFATLPLQSDTGRDAGTLRVAARWKFDFKTARTTSGATLTDEELDWILATFSPRKDGQVDYLGFLHELDASPAVASARSKLRAFVERCRVAQDRDARDLFGHLDVETMGEDDFADALAGMTVGAPRDELCAFLRHERKATSGRFGTEELIAACGAQKPVEANVRSKLRAHVAKLRRLGRPLAGPFEDLDAARAGRLPRPHFKQALKHLGLELVDEAPRRGEEPAVDIARRQAVERRLGSVIEDEPYEDDPRSTDDILRDVDAAPSAAEDDAARKQREFHDRVRDAREERERILAAARAEAPPRDAGDEPGGLFDFAEPPAAAPEVAGDAVAVGRDGGENYPDRTHGAAAVAADAMTPPRRASPRREASAPGSPEAASHYITADVTAGVRLPEARPPTSGAPILAAEDALDAARRRLEGVAAPPDLRPAFVDCDAAGAGTVRRDDAAAVLRRRAREYPLAPELLAAVLDHFSRGDLFDYGAFLTFLETAPAPPSAAARAAARIVFHDGALARLRAADARRDGSLPADAFRDALAGLGVDLAADELRCVARLFPPKHAARGAAGAASRAVDYGAFAAYAGEAAASTRFRALEARLREALGTLLEAGTLREAFRRADTRGRAALERDDFEALVDNVLGAPAAGRLEVRGLAAVVDPGSAGVAYDALVEYARLPPSLPPPGGPPDWAHLRGRCRAALAEADERLGANRNAAVVKAQFARYDWRGADVLDPRVFASAGKRAGLCLSEADLVALGDRFAVDPALATVRGAAWKRFLAWAATPDVDDAKQKLDGLLRKLGDDVLTTRAWARGVFDGLDRDDSGRLAPKAFKRALVEDLRSDMRDDDLDFVVTHFLDPRGDVVYRDFVASVEAAADGGDDEPAAPAPHRQTRADAGDVLRDALKAQVRAGVDYRAAFEKEDGAYSGVLGRDAFARVLRALGCRLDASDLDALENRYRAATRGGVHYVELLNGVLPVRPEAGEAWRVEEKLRAMIKRRFEWWQPGRLRRAFKHFDTKRRGRVDAADLADGLRALKLKLSGEQERDLFAAMDLDGDGWVEYPEFLVFVKDPCHAFLEQKVRYLSHKRKLTPRDAADALADVDGNGSGLIGARDFGVVLDRLGVDLAASERARLAARFDPSEDGNVDGGRFLRFLKGDSEAGGAADAPPGLRALRSAIDRLAERRGRAPDYARVFDDFDADGSGKLEPREFKRALKALGFEDLGADDVRDAVAAFDGDGDGKVDFREFVAFAAGGGREDEERTNRVERALRKELERLGGSKKLRRAFEDMDANGSGKLSRRELGRALDDLGFRLDRADVDALMARFDRDGDGKVSWKEFVAFADGGGAALLEGDVDDVLDRLKNAVADAKRDGLKVEDCFDAFDRDGSGDVDEREFQKGMKKLGVSLSAYETKKVFARFPGRDGTVRLRDFYDAVGRGDARDPPGVAAVKREVKRLAKSRDGAPDFARELRKSTDARVIDSARDLRRSLEAMDIEITRDEAADVLEAVGGRDGAPVADVAKLLESAAGAGKKEEPAGFRLLRSEIRRLGQRSEGPPDYKRVFRALDRDGSGYLEPREFRRGLEKLGFEELSSEDLRAVVDRLDVDGDGRVSLREFLKFADASGDDRTTRLERAVFKEVRRLARGRRNRLRDAFLEFDDNDSGKINKREFRRALERLGFELSADDVDGLVDRFDVDGDGKVSYAEFVGWCDRGAGAGAREEDQDDVLKLLRDACRDRLDGGSSPRAVFERLDRDGDGTVDEDEFARGLRKLGLELTAYEVRKAMDRFPGRRGRVKYDDFLEAVKPSRSRSREPRGALEPLRAELERLARRSGGPPDYRRAFRDLDADGSGRLERREFRRGLEKLGFEFDGGEFDRVVERLDRDGDGTVSLREFLKFAEGSGSRPEDSDDAVDEVMGRLRGLVRDAMQDGLSPADCFEHFDRDGSGDLDEREFTKGMKKLGVEMTAYEVRKVMDRFPGGRRGRVRYRDFVKAVAPASRRGSDRGSRSPRASSKSRERAAGALRALRKEAKRSRDRRGKRPNYARAFEVYDYAGDGAVSRADLDRALASLGFELSSSDARRVADRFDRDGAVAWRDLARYADGDGDGDDDDDDDALKRLRSLVRDAVDDGLSPDDIFAHFDLDGDGTIDEREFAKAMKKLGVSLSSREVRKTMAQFPGRREGRLKYRDFLKAILPSSRSKRSGDRSPRRSPRSSRRY